jgi:hypothetical protein
MLPLARAVALGREVIMASQSRHVLEDGVIGAASQVLMSRPSSIRDCLAVLRVPWRCGWFEWREDARRSVRERLGIVHDNGKATPSRCGFLVEAAPDGRSGFARLAWSHRDGEPPSVSPLRICFDLDRMGRGGPVPGDDARSASDLYRRWARSPSDLDALDAVNGALWLDGLDGSRAQAASIAAALGGGVGLAQALHAADIDDVEGEALHVLAVTMLLTARNATSSRPGEDRTRLNRARARRGEPPLADHVIVGMRLSAAERREAAMPQAATSRASPRLHLVAGHFVRRGDAHFWRVAHARGDPARVAAGTRTIHVSL